MGPRSHDRGNGHIVLSAAMGHKASMGPRSHDRGNAHQNEDSGRQGQASMGPRSHDRGNSPSAAREPELNKLQWGRGRMTAETLR